MKASMKRRFSSLNFTDVAAWLVAITTFMCLAAAGAVLGQLRKLESRSHTASRPDLTPGI